MFPSRRKSIIFLWILQAFVEITTANRSGRAPFCTKKSVHNDVTLLGGMVAGTYTHWEPRDPRRMTVDRCTEHCCESPDTDVVFLLHRRSLSNCFCVKCHSAKLCSLVKITPPAGFKPVAVTLSPRISKLSTSTPSVSYTRSIARTQSTKPRSKPTTVQIEKQKTRKGNEGGTKNHEDVTTKSPEATSDHGLGRRNGTDHANLEVKNANLPVVNGYQKTKDGPKPEAITSYNGINGGSTLPTTPNIDVNFTTPVPTTNGPTTPRPTRMVKTEKKAEGTGNDDISLQCPGTIKVIRVGAFGIPGDNKTVDDFERHCDANLAEVDGTNVCIVSLKRVYKNTYPPFIKTHVTYTCSYTEYVS